MRKKLLLSFVCALVSVLSATAQETYAVYTSSSQTLTFYYDTQRATRPGTTYDLNVTGTLPAWYELRNDIVDVEFDPSFAGARPITTYHWFGSMKNLTTITGMNYLNTSEVTKMGSMFSDCSRLTTLDLSSFNTSKVTDMSFMFYKCARLKTIYVSSAWNTDAVTESTDILKGCFDLRGGKNTAYNDSHTDISYAHIDEGPSNPGYFTEALHAPYVVFTTGNSTLTYYCDGDRWIRTGLIFDLNEDDATPEWILTRVPIGGSNVSLYNLVINVVFDASFSEARPTNTYRWFKSMGSLTTVKGLYNLNTSTTTSMREMFYSCTNLTTLDLSGFSTPTVTDMQMMFYNCNKLVTIYAGDSWNTEAVTRSTDMFKACQALVGGQGTTYDSNHVDKAYAHIDGGPGNPGYFTVAQAQPYCIYNETNKQLTFYYDNLRASRPGITYDLNTWENEPLWLEKKESITGVVIHPSFHDARPTSTYGWFAVMPRLTAIFGLDNLNTSEVTNMGAMFMNSVGLTTLDLSCFNTAKVRSTMAMFMGCSNLTTIYVGEGWNTDAVTNSSAMFNGCNSLTGGQGTTYDASHTDKAYAHIDGGPGNPGYFTAATKKAYAKYTEENTTLTFYCDDQYATRPGGYYNMPTLIPEWMELGGKITHVVFDPSFAQARPTMVFGWFALMENLKKITGLEHFNTSEVTVMAGVFAGCTSLTTLDLSSFNTVKVQAMNEMFSGCTSLKTVYVGEGWTTDGVVQSDNMFNACTQIKGSQGTTYDANHIDKTYAHIDGGPGNPGYFTEKPAFLRGDVNGDGKVNVSDVTALINMILGVILKDEARADINGDGKVNVSDVTALINIILS